MSVQHKLFSYARNGEMLTGSQVVKADRTRKLVRQLQRHKQMVEDWKLDIFCRNTSQITDIRITTIDPVCALGSDWRYGISIVNMPVSKSISPYTLTVAWFRSLKEAEVMLEVVRGYLGIRYGVRIFDGVVAG